MFVNNLGIRLILLVGSAVPRPAPPEVMSAITRIQVTNSDDSGDGFQMTLTLGRGKIPDYTLLNGGSLNLFNRVIIGVLLGVMPEVLIDGVITNHQIAPSNDSGMSTLTVTGKDISQMMDLEEANDRYPNQSDSVIVGRLLGNYARYGLIPAVAPTTEIPSMKPICAVSAAWRSETALSFMSSPLPLVPARPTGDPKHGPGCCSRRCP
jgi:hypothetical protein